MSGSFKCETATDFICSVPPLSEQRACLNYRIAASYPPAVCNAQNWQCHAHNGDNPAAIKSAFTKLGKSTSVGKNSRAKVVLPAPFGTAIMTMRLLCVDEFMISI